MSILANFESLEIKPFIQSNYFTEIFCPPTQSTSVQHVLSDEERLNDTLEQVMNLSIQDRTAFLDLNCYNDPLLRDKIEKLLIGIDVNPPEHFLNPSDIADRLNQYLHADQSD
ncbi:MAG: hypothetical protein AB8G77_15530 [Rhodothermales bacterium]